jgi:outer membrane protein assembly factor BamB
MFMEGSGNRRWRLPIYAAIAALVLMGAGLGAYFEFVKPPGNVSHPTVEFTTPTSAPRAGPKPETFKWPFYGYTADRNRHLDANIHPPFYGIWQWKSGSLIEFQPIIVNGVLYVVPNNGLASALDAKTGKRLWKTSTGSLNASSPAWAKGRLFIVSLSGRITCLEAKNGKVVWRRILPSRSESSPVVIDGVVYFGSENGTVYALRASDGGRVWTYHAGGAVKGGLAYKDGILYFGDYSGTVTALRASNGSKVWSTDTSGRAFQQSGRFYSTPAVAYGRVFLGNTDGFVYSFGAHSGQLAWRYQTGAYVYSAAAVGPGPGGRPTVFIGSYDHNFYAFDARSGNVLWTYRAVGRISGAPTLIGRVVYFSDLDFRGTSGLDARTGRRVFTRHTGKFNPMISDGKRMYMTGFSTIYTMVPVSELPQKRRNKLLRVNERPGARR